MRPGGNINSHSTCKRNELRRRAKCCGNGQHRYVQRYGSPLQLGLDLWEKEASCRGPCTSCNRSGSAMRSRSKWHRGRRFQCGGHGGRRCETCERRRCHATSGWRRCSRWRYSGRRWSRGSDECRGWHGYGCRSCNGCGSYGKRSQSKGSASEGTRQEARGDSRSKEGCDASRSTEAVATMRQPYFRRIQ
jgi:hypothetical protein